MERTRVAISDLEGGRVSENASNLTFLDQEIIKFFWQLP